MLSLKFGKPWQTSTVLTYFTYLLNLGWAVRQGLALDRRSGETKLVVILACLHESVLVGDRITGHCLGLKHPNSQNRFKTNELTFGPENIHLYRWNQPATTQENSCLCWFRRKTSFFGTLSCPGSASLWYEKPKLVEAGFLLFQSSQLRNLHFAEQIMLLFLQMHIHACHWQRICQPPTKV